MSNSKIVLGYWELRGLAQPTRLLAAYLGIQLNEKRYTLANFEEWMNKDKLTLGLDFPNVPYMIDGDLKITESRAVLKYFARKYGQTVFPSKVEDMAVCEMVENVLFDVWMGALKYFVTPDVAPQKEYFDQQVPAKLKYLDTFLANKKFVLGNQISFVDFFLYEMTYHFTAYKADFLNQYSNIVQFKKRFEEIPAIAKYMSSKDYIKGPCVNPHGKIAF